MTTPPPKAAPTPQQRKRRWRGWWLKQLHSWHWISAALSLGQASAEEAAAVAEGAALGAYTFTEHHGVGKASSAKPELTEAVVPGVAADEAEQLAASTTAVVEAVRFARDLVNTPPNRLYPESLAATVT